MKLVLLGMQVTHQRDSKIVTLSQPGYIDQLMSKFQISVETSTNPTIPMSPTDFSDPIPIPLTQAQQTLFMQIVGSLLLLSTRSRPDCKLFIKKHDFKCKISKP
jgi:hypothetical protein